MLRRAMLSYCSKTSNCVALLNGDLESAVSPGLTLNGQEVR